MAKNWKLIHMKSKQRGEDGISPKLPTPDILEYGEIAINFGSGIERISLKNENNEIITFIPEYKIKEYIDAKINEMLKEIKNTINNADDDNSIDSGEY